MISDGLGIKNPGTGWIQVVVFRVPSGPDTRKNRTGQIRVKWFGYWAGNWVVTVLNSLSFAFIFWHEHKFQGLGSAITTLGFSTEISSTWLLTRFYAGFTSRFSTRFTTEFTAGRTDECTDGCTDGSTTYQMWNEISTDSLPYSVQDSLPYYPPSLTKNVLLV